ncbi:MAG: exo-alpha-sialidase [Clostridiales bacterium]|nr:exo-alpha-sialidase [Clostridiales bacterium]
MRFTKNILEKAIGNKSIKIYRKYIDSSLKMEEVRTIQTESDFDSFSEKRYSDDNGKTWSDYTENKEYYKKDGEKEILEVNGNIKYNKKHNHVVKIVMQRVFLYNHHDVYEKYWDKGILNWCDYTYIKISTDNGQTFNKSYKLSYEPNVDFYSNRGYFGNNVEIDKSGNIYTAIVAPLESCCKIAKTDEKKIASNGEITSGVFVFKGVFNEKTSDYDFSFSKPIMITDLQSSRGLLEPNIILLKSGELMLECRGSNTIREGWNTRTQPNTPSYRWVSFSDDGGKTFTQPSPLTFDNSEKFYSPSSISNFLRLSSSNKLFWIGNISKNLPDGNRPRYPFYICEMNEEKKCLIKSSCMIIDDKTSDDSELIQFSNFNVYEDKLSNNIHIEYSRLGANDSLKWQGDAIKIVVTP